MLRTPTLSDDELRAEIERRRALPAPASLGETSPAVTIKHSARGSLARRYDAGRSYEYLGGGRRHLPRDHLASL